MKNKVITIITAAVIVLAITLVVVGVFTNERSKVTSPKIFTNLEILNSSKRDSVCVYLTLQAPNSVVGLFGITDTLGSCSNGYFWAHKGISYFSNDTNTLLGVVIAFDTINLPCQVAVPNGFPTGINIFECSINTPFEVFDISCEDGINSIIKTSVTDSLYWSTGDAAFQDTFLTATNQVDFLKNLNLRGVFPYRCTDCKDSGAAVPQNCFNLKDTCSTNRICQVARTGHNGKVIKIEYLGQAWVPLSK